MEIELTGQQVEQLKKSFRKIDTQKFSNYFYAQLFEEHPELRHLFPTDMNELKTKLVSVFELVAFSFAKTKTGKYALEPELLLPLQNLGRLHEEKGVQKSHYAIVNDLIPKVFAYCLGPAMTKMIDTSWKLALAQLTHAMLNTEVIEVKQRKDGSVKSLSHPEKKQKPKRK